MSEEYPNAIPCLCCGKPLKDWSGGNNQPFDALEFASPGHFPSAIFDGGPGELIVNICDDCLFSGATAGRVLRRMEPRRRGERADLEPWTGKEDRRRAFKAALATDTEDLIVNFPDTELPWAVAQTIAALAVDVQPDAGELAAAPVLDRWRWSSTDTAGLYVRGVVDGAAVTTGEVADVDAGRRWVRDRDAKLWRLGAAHLMGS